MQHLWIVQFSLACILAFSCSGSPATTETATPLATADHSATRNTEPAAEISKVPEVGARSDADADESGEPQPRPEPRPARPTTPPSPIRVAIYRAPGVSFQSHQATLDVLRAAGGVTPRVATPDDVRGGALEGHHVVIFTGGRGSVQGESLGDDGRQIVRDFVASGGGYVGVCAGSYLAMQGEEEFFKLAIVAARNLTGDSWRRGEHTVEIQEVGGTDVHRLFYANGPVFARVEHPTIAPFVPLATFLSDAYLPAHGTRSGEMPGTPAILAAEYGQGRIILFSPNPVLAAEDESTSPDMMVRAVRWVATPGSVPSSLRFADVFR